MSANVHLKIIGNQDEAKAELKKIGVDEISIPMMAPKMQYWVLKMTDVDVRAANLIKQEMLSKGGEAAVAKWSAGFTKPETDVLLMGSLKHFRLLLRKMRLQPFGLKKLAVEIEKVISNYKKVKTSMWKCLGKDLSIGERTLIMGVLNITPDSFSDSGSFTDHSKALEHAFKMIEEGADIIDVGGESTRPDSSPVSSTDEIDRVIPVIKALRQKSDVAISIDTQKSEVARVAIESGANIVNDVSALSNDKEMQKVVSETESAVILMHMKGTPKNMQDNPTYDDVVSEINQYLERRVEKAIEAGIKAESIAIDPGFGFGKTPDHNLEILRRLKEFKSLGLPIVLGTSRKSTIGAVLNLPVDDRIEGTGATVAVGIANGASVVRVHDVKEMSRVARMADAINGREWDG